MAPPLLKVLGDGCVPLLSFTMTAPKLDLGGLKVTLKKNPMSKGIKEIKPGTCSRDTWSAVRLACRLECKMMTMEPLKNSHKNGIFQLIFTRL